MLPFFSRALLEALLQRMGANESVEPAANWMHHTPPVLHTPEPPAANTPHYYDNILAMGYRRLDDFPASKIRTRYYDLRKRNIIVVHQMGVAFGVSKRRVRYWASIAAAEGKNQDDAAEFGRRMALHERFWKVPYHFASLRNGDILFNNPLRWYTHHGTLGNYGIGWAMDGKYPFRSDGKFNEFLIETGRAGFRLAVTMAREGGCPIEGVQPHRCFDKNRRVDTGEDIWREIVLPLCKELAVEPDYELKRGSGLQICREWDDNALYDYRGRRVA